MLNNYSLLADSAVWTSLRSCQGGIMTKRFLVIFAIGSLLVGCLEQSKDVANTPAGAIQGEVQNTEGKISITAATLDGSTITLVGFHMEKVSGLKIKTAAGAVDLTIENKKNHQIIAKPKGALAFTAGTIYRLMISSAKAEDVEVPITISVTLPNLAVSASCGQAQSSALAFAGYTTARDANLGGVKGANKVCEEAFPGSHWASSDEIARLGSKYPWATAVWVRDFSDGNYRSLTVDCRGFWSNFVGAGMDCRTNPDSTTYGGPSEFLSASLTANGQVQFTCCNALRALACVR